MSGTATQLTNKFRKDVETVSRDKVRGAIVKRLQVLFADAPAIRGKRGLHGKWTSKALGSGLGQVRIGAARKKRK
jgi:hypothetical protein